MAQHFFIELLALHAYFDGNDGHDYVLVLVQIAYDLFFDFELAEIA